MAGVRFEVLLFDTIFGEQLVKLAGSNVCGLSRFSYSSIVSGEKLFEIATLNILDEFPSDLC